MPENAPPVQGHRQLSAAEIALVNEIKAKGAELGELIDQVDRNPESDPRCAACARTNIQQGLMWLVRSVTRPEGFA